MLTAHQAEKEEIILELIKKKEKRIVIKGSAGVGKTFLVNHLIQSFRNIIKYGTIYITAPTHQALRILREKTTIKEYVEFATIHSALQLTRKIDLKTGEEKFVRKKYNPKYPPLPGCSLMIIDEASMLGEEMVGSPTYSTKPKLGILEEPEFKNILVIFIGDDKQLNPIGEESSPVFEKGYPEVLLTEIVRQGKDNPVISLSYMINKVFSKEQVVSTKTKLKNVNEEYAVTIADKLLGYGFDDIDNNGKTISTIEQDYLEGYVYTNDRDKIVERLAEVNGTNELKYIAYKNDDIDKMNNDVRNKIYNNPRKIEEKEIIVLNAPYGEFNNNDEVKIISVKDIMKEFIIPNENTTFFTEDDNIIIREGPMKDREGNIIKDEKGEPIYPYGREQLRVFHCEVQKYTAHNNTYINGYITILHDDSEARFNYLIRIINGLCIGGMVDWRLKYWFKELVVDFKYNHAKTVHKAQGSTYEKAILNIGNINLNKNVAEKKRLFYTAITRVSELVILYNVK